MAAPVVAFAAPELLPGALVVTSMTLPTLTVITEWRHIHWRGLAWGLPARVPGALAGAWLVRVLGPRALGAVVGVMVLLATAASLWSARVRIRPASLLTAGAVSGLTGTATSIGGPPLALLYQHEPAARVRATLGAFFFFGAAISLAALALAGELDGEQIRAGLLLTPFVLAGFLAGRPLRTRLGPARSVLSDQSASSDAVRPQALGGLGGTPRKAPDRHSYLAVLGRFGWGHLPALAGGAARCRVWRRGPGKTGWAGPPGAGPARGALLATVAASGAALILRSLA
ncbi:sulfite exporter TauE/SafE family protein [Streptomyces litchfieldiae]|uniref:Probable membrane transporter protein n=1 Tax=Streptomyces litchfieldiae TaxID=3075543 RepID=A0ABU2MP59_9ACTN|nr:sulfite exporter TauE/SafE family protein [Streptomyces sp. DSM 44938]MDT0343246.1 sulfite exporter TauE/SafE family protein [Streptomyces sp. DSM 44938]